MSLTRSFHPTNIPLNGREIIAIMQLFIFNSGRGGNYHADFRSTITSVIIIVIIILNIDLKLQHCPRQFIIWCPGSIIYASLIKKKIKNEKNCCSMQCCLYTYKLDASPNGSTKWVTNLVARVGGQMFQFGPRSSYSSSFLFC